MEHQLAKDIIAILPDDRTLFRYDEDRYAFMLLDYAFSNGVPIAKVKRSRFARLLERPAVKKLLANSGNGKLSCDEFARAWQLTTQSYVLSLGLWGSQKAQDRDWYQTSRTGTNLVLQLNFDGRHDQALKRLLGPYHKTSFAYDGHPVNRRGRNTLAWSRIDLDLDHGEALIEELQNDWLRNAAADLEGVRQHCDDNMPTRMAMERYYNDVLVPHVNLWSEAMLSAVLFFLIDEIGIRNIWLHDFETGNRLKKLKWGQPPRSLYTSLPKRFCFEKVAQAPKFLFDGVSRDQRKRFNAGKERFWKLAV
jgi:hypothetical protein